MHHTSVMSSIAAALFFFNAGVEVGQLAFIAIMLVLIAVILRGMRSVGIHASHLSQVEGFSAYALGIPSAFWGQVAGFLDFLRENRKGSAADYAE